MSSLLATILLSVIALPVFLINDKCFAAEMQISDAGPETITADNQEYTATVRLHINADDGTQYYLRGVLAKENSREYCGATWNGTNWFSGPYSTGEGWKQFLPVTVASESAATTLKMMPNAGNTPCGESGPYVFRVQRFTQSGSGSFDEQEEKRVTILIPTIVITVTPTHTISPSITPKPTKNISVTATRVPTEMKREQERLQIIPSITSVQDTVLAAETTSISTSEGTFLELRANIASGTGDTVLVDSEKSMVPGLLLGVGMFCVGLGGAWGYYAFLRLHNKHTKHEDL